MVLDSEDTPGGCWAHFSAVTSSASRLVDGVEVSEFKSLTLGDVVDFEWETPGQDGFFEFRATAVRRIS